MKSKEEWKAKTLPIGSDDGPLFSSKQVDFLMDEYAKQEAEAYEKWLYDSRYTRKSAPFVDLWGLYLESKKQKA